MLLLGLLVLIVGLSAVAAFITKVLTDDGDEAVESDPTPAPVVPLPQRTLPRADARKAA